MTDAPHLAALCEHIERNLDDAPQLLVGLAALLGDRRAYEVPKVGLTFCLQSHVHQLVLGSAEMKLALSEGSPFSRHVHNDKYMVIFEGIVPEEVNNTAYDVCISFAGRDREVAERIADAVRSNGMDRRVFYDMYERNDLWGTDLTKKLHDLYANQSKFCVILFSRCYLERAWTRHELRAVQVRLLQEREDYVLPVELHKGTIPSEFTSVGYWEFNSGDEEQIALAVEEKINNYISKHYSSIEEITELFNIDAVCAVASNEIIDQALEAREESRRQGLICLGLLLAADIPKLLPRYRALVDYVLFSPGLVGSLFGSNNRGMFRGLGLGRAPQATIAFSREWNEIFEARMPRYGDDRESDIEPGETDS